MKLLIFIISFNSICLSQTVNSKIGHDSINTKLLNELVINQINKERVIRKISPLTFSKAAYFAAKLHNDWLIESNKFEHSKNGVIEIVESTYCFDTMTYDYLSKFIVKTWMDSPGHRANILDVTFKYLGVSINDYSKIQNSKTYLYPAETITNTTFLIKATCVFNWTD